MSRKLAARLHEKFYSHSKYDGTSLFFNKIRAKLSQDAVVLNLGAGPETGDSRVIQPGECRSLFGADIDPVVLQNRELSEARIIVDGKLPFDDATFDVVFSDYVLEHVEKPNLFLGEVRRVLKPGGSYFFRTPNMFHYVTIIARYTPHAFHELIANPSRGLKQEAHAPWPTYFRMNTRRSINRLSQGAGLTVARLDMVEGHPSYLMFNGAAFIIGMSYERLVNFTKILASFRSNIQGELRKPISQSAQ